MKGFSVMADNKNSPAQEMSIEEFRNWRQGMGLTQHAAAMMLGFKHRSSICHIEKGVKSITPQVAMLCGLLQRTVR